MEREVLLPVDAVEVPEKWRRLPEDFLEAVSIVQQTAGRDESQFSLTCVHISPDWVEACQPPGTMVTTSNGRVPIESISQGHQVWCYSYQQKGKASRSIIGANEDCCNQFKQGHTVTKVGQRQYVGDLVVLTAGKKTTRYTTDHECLVRLDNAFAKKYVVYIMQRGMQFRVGVTGPRMWKGKWMNPRRDGRADVRVRMNAQRADCCWVLACFDTESDALAEEQFVVARYGIPDMLFRVRPGETGSKKRCDSFWKRFGDNLEGAKSCLRAYGRDLDYPFVKRDGESGEPRRYPGSKPSHMSDVEIKIRACNLLVGMKVLDAGKCKNGKVTDKCWVPFTLNRESYSGPVYSMTVDRAHTYIGDGIVTHNCDNFQLTRYTLATGVKESVLVRRSSVKHVVGLGMTKTAQTENWIHFKGPSGLVLSCRRYVEDFPDLAGFLKVKGKQTTLPKGLGEAAEKAEIFSAENVESNNVTVTLKPGSIRIEGRGISGWYSETKKTDWDGDAIRFAVAPKLLIELVKNHNRCEITADRLKVDGGKFVYVSCLGTVEEKE